MSEPARLPRDLHPVAWWLWAIGLAVAASFTTNPLVLLMLIGVAGWSWSLRRSDQPWGQSFRLYVWLGVVIVVVRVVVLGPLRRRLGRRPGAARPAGGPAARLGRRASPCSGRCTREALLFALYDGLRLATIVICVGAANSLANPKRLLRSVPPALYEIGTALVVAVTVLPQFAESARRVRAAQSLRAGDTRRVGRLRRFLVPVLEDALERSLALAAGMDTRGYGRAGRPDPAQRRTTGALMLVGLGRHLRRHLRRPRHHRAADPGAADAGARRGRRGRRAAQRRAAGSSAPATARTRGAGPSSR